MKTYLPTLFPGMVMAFGIVTVCQAQDTTPSIDILSPKSMQVVHMGEQAVISWQVHNLPTPESHWKVYALLEACRDGAGYRQIYSGALDKTPRQITWTPPQGMVDDQKMGYAPIHWYVVIELYDETTDHEEELQMEQTCHAFGGDWLVTGASDEPVYTIEP